MNIKNKICHVSRLLNIKMPDIIFNDLIGFSYSKGTLYLRRIGNEKELLFLSLHELRHYYQDLYIKNNNDSLSIVWKKEMDNYNLKCYINYNIELDAYAFSYLVLKHIFKINYDLPYEIKDKVLDYIKKFEILYSIIINYKL